MPVTCQDLHSLKCFSSIKLLAGAQGLDHAITWPLIGQTVEISPWVHGGELLFITGIVHNQEMLPALLRECIEKKLAGLVVLVGREYIREISPELVAQAEAARFPLYAMPFELKLVDVTRDIADLIVRDKLKQKDAEDFLNSLIFSTEDKATLPEDLSPENCCVAAVFQLSPQEDEKPDVAERLQHHVLSLCAAKYIKVHTCVHGTQVIAAVFAPAQDTVTAAVSYLEASRAVISQLCNDPGLLLGFGRVYHRCKDVRQSYREAASALQLARKIQRFEVVHYQKLGIYSLLLQVQDTDALHRYYQDFLNPILAYDHKSNAGLLATLRAYLMCHGSISKTAQQTFVHRNTLLYRLNQIRDLTGCDLEDPYTRTNLFVAVLIEEYLRGK